MTGQTISVQTQLLRMEGIVKTFPGVRANDGIDLEVKPGEVHALLGENGAGKTTLMRALVGLYKIDAGKVFWKGEQVHITSPAVADELGIGMVHQQFSLIPTFSVAENVALGSRNKRKLMVDLPLIGREIQDLANQYSFNLDPNARIDQLSMGARQRVEIVEILYRRCKLLILDEPSSVLTPQEIIDLFKIISRLLKENHSVIFITHKLDEVMSISNRVTIFRDGRVIGSTPTNQVTQESLAYMMVGRTIDFDVKKPKFANQKPLLKAVNLTKRWGDGNQELKNVIFEVNSGEILGIAGVGGNGQEKIVEIISGLNKCDCGNIFIDGIDVTGTSPQFILNSGIVFYPR